MVGEQERQTMLEKEEEDSGDPAAAASAACPLLPSHPFLSAAAVSRARSAAMAC